MQRPPIHCLSDTYIAEILSYSTFDSTARGACPVYKIYLQLDSDILKVTGIMMSKI